MSTSTPEKRFEFFLKFAGHIPVLSQYVHRQLQKESDAREAKPDMSPNREGHGNYRYDRNHYDKYLPDVIGHLWHHAEETENIRPATRDEDNQHATDIVIETQAGRSINVGCRLRETGFRDLTIRTTRLNKRGQSVPTEISKLKESDLYYYGWIEEGEIREYIIINTAKLPDLSVYPERWNDDRSTAFIAVPISEIRDAIIYHEHITKG